MKNKRKYIAPHVLGKADKLIFIEKYRNNKDFNLSSILELCIDKYAEEKGYNFNPTEETLEQFEKIKARKGKV